MIVPPVALIEQAIDDLKHRDSAQLRAQLKELHMAGLRLKFDLIVPTTNIERGYLLGLETARVVLQTMPAAIMAKVTI
jgi:hypothetical protein